MASIEPAKIAALRELIDLSYPREALRQTMSAVVENIRPQMADAVTRSGLSEQRAQEFTDAYFKAFLAKAPDAFPRESLIPVYDRYYSLADVRQLIAFYHTPLGQKLVTTTPRVIGDVQRISSRWGVEFAQHLMRDVAASFVELQKTAPSNPQALPAPSEVETDLYPPIERATDDVNRALARAAKSRKNVLLVFGGNWCYDCHVLDAAFKRPDLEPLLEANYEVVNVNVGEIDKNLELAGHYGVNLKKGVPALAVVAPDGSVLYGQKNGEFEAARRLSAADVRQFLEQWKPKTK